jgi:UDP-GlcNAc:undecaprenyl-phosphate GlcNAc-1-phosphate transferase
MGHPSRIHHVALGARHLSGRHAHHVAALHHLRDHLPVKLVEPTVLDAVLAFLLATALTALLTPLTMRLARWVGAIDEPRERGLSERPTPLLGGLAIAVGTLAGGLIWLRHSGDPYLGMLLAGVLIVIVGALDDRFDLPWWLKLGGQAAAALIAVDHGVRVDVIYLPFVGKLTFPHVGGILTALGLIVMMNVVNFTDGVDGLAAGVCAIMSAALAIIAFNLGHPAAGVLAGLIAGGSVGFLFHNFPPARSFMGDCGANLLGLLMGCLTVEGSVKTPVVVSFVLPLMLLAVPFLDTTFVVLKRLKYHQPFYAADSEHFHHRMARIGYSPRRTIFLLYGWTLMLALFTLALFVIPYSDHHGHLHAGWSVVLGLIGLLVAGASVYLVYVLEILKFRRLDAMRLRRLRPQATPGEIDAAVTADLETGEYDTVVPPPPASRAAGTSTRTMSATPVPGARAPIPPPPPL